MKRIVVLVIKKSIVVLRDGVILENDDDDDEDAAAIVDTQIHPESTPMLNDVAGPSSEASAGFPSIVEPSEIIEPSTVETDNGLPVESDVQRNRRLLIQKNLDKSMRVREIGIAARLKKANAAASSSLPPSASHPAHALPVINSGSFTAPPHITNAIVEPRLVDLFEFACGDTSTIGVIGPKLKVRVF